MQGRLIESQPVDLFDPVNDYVTAELARRLVFPLNKWRHQLTDSRAAEYTSEKHVSIYVGTFNLNGQTVGLNHDLSEWLIPNFVEKFQGRPEIVVVGFQEIVELSPQQIMSTDPAIRQLWEKAVLRCLNKDAEDPYVLLRGGQLVGAALLIFVRKSSIGYIKNVEGSLKKVRGYVNEKRARLMTTDRVVWCSWQQGCGGHPTGLCKYSPLLRDRTFGSWLLEHGREKSRLPDDCNWPSVPKGKND